MQSVIHAKTRKWGNSLGIIIPREAVEDSHLKKDQKVNILILKDTTDLFNKTFGMLKGKFNKSSQQIKDELRAELYDE